MKEKKLNECLKCDKCEHFPMCKYVNMICEKNVLDYSDEFPFMVEVKCNYFKAKEILTR